MHLFMLSIAFSGNIELFAETIYPLIVFDMLHIDQLNEIFFNFD